MATTTLPLTETLSPADTAGVCDLVREAHGSATPVYPIGGGTSLDYGRPATREGIGLSLAGMNQIVDYPARDMTITLGAGVTMQALRETLAAEGQQLPVDVPHADDATIGGVLATNWNGPRRLGYGPLRDYVIGIEAVDGRGMVFHGGGRVVKNVAGYDFCKLLTGSLGTLGVITQVTLKVRPLPVARRSVVYPVANWDNVERLLSSLHESHLRPVAVNLMAGACWGADHEAELAVVFEDGDEEVAWQIETLEALWQSSADESIRRLDTDQTSELLANGIDFPANSDTAVTLKATMTAGGVAEFASLARSISPECHLLAHAANGIVFLGYDEDPDDLGKLVHDRLRPLATKHSGHVMLVSRATGGELTSQLVWGGLGDTLHWMCRVRDQFDPAGILNPGRFLFS